MTTQQPTTDPMDSAMDAEYSPRSTYFGEIRVQSWYCILQRGQGKVPFDANLHSADARRTAIDLALYPLPGSQYTGTMERNLLAESKEWAQIVKPSLRALGVDLRGINGKWAQVELAPTGRTYVNKSGETKDATTFKFIAVYPTEDACIESANQRYYPDDTTLPGNATAAAPPPAPGNGGSNLQRATAAKFLPALWAASGRDVAKFAEKLSSMKPVSDFFTIDSPEVLAIIAPF